MISPASLLDADIPVLSSIKLSAIVVLEVLTVVVSPFTVKLPVTVKFAEATTLPENVADVSLITSSLLPSHVTVNAPFEPESDTIAVVLPAVSVVDDRLDSPLSTYALIDCCEATAVASFDPKLSSSRKNPDSMFPESMFVRLFPVALASYVLFVNVNVSAAILPSCVST